MKRLTKASALLTALFICALSATVPRALLAQTQPASAVTSNKVQLVIEGKVINVHDGDTITVLDQSNKKFNIRLQGIDAPELKQEFGSISQQNLSRLVMGKRVTIVWTKVDKYRRTVGTIMLDGHDMNIEQVKAGMAWHYKKYADEQNPEDRRTYAGAELQARAASLGLWKDPDPTPPGDWRTGIKTKRWGPPPPEGTIVGNSNSKKYHRPECPGYRDMAERNRVFFKTVAEAEAAGFKRAGNCPPETAIFQKTSSTAQEPKATQSPTTSSMSSADAKPSTANGSQEQPVDIIGNKNSKIYHTPGCSTYNSVSEKNRVFFRSATEAENAGFRRAKNCK